VNHIPLEPINQGIVAGLSFLIPVVILVIILKIIVSNLKKRKKDNTALFILIGRVW